jgi:periplasmic protein TonB
MSTPRRRGFIGEDEMTTIPHSAAPAGERRTLTIMLVGALHLAAIYAILVSLHIAPSPIPSTTTTIRYIDPVQTNPPQTPPVVPTSHLPFTNPADPNPAVPPDIDIGSDQGPGGTTTTPPGTGDVFAPLSAVAGTHTIPDYPALDRRFGHQGAVGLMLSIDAQGYVIDARLAQSSGYEGLDAAAIEWVKTHWRYRPAMHNGVPMPTTTRASVVFRLTQTGY